MQGAIRKSLARAYRLTTRAPGAEELVEVRPGLSLPGFVVEWARSGPEATRTFLARLPVPVELAGRSVLAVGRGAADLGIEAAHGGAAAVTAIEMAPGRDEISRLRLEEEGQTLPVEIRSFGGTLEELEGKRVDAILAFDAFRSYGAAGSDRALEERIGRMAGRLGRGGVLAVGLGPLWKSPRGGGVDSRLPWAHLLFPEVVIFDEFRRVRRESHAHSFDDIGVNRITLERFLVAIGASGLECVGFATNVGEGRAIRAARVLSRLPGLGEYLTQNAYGVWARPERGRRPARPAPQP